MHPIKDRYTTDLLQVKQRHYTRVQGIAEEGKTRRDNSENVKQMLLIKFTRESYILEAVINRLKTK